MVRARIEIVLALVLAALTLMSIVWPRWIELLTGLDPDVGNGEAEWFVVAVFALAAVAVALLAGRDWRTARGRQPAADTATF